MDQIIEKFGLDWRLLIAHGVNFLILFYILNRFVYKPIVATLNKRREDIEKGIEFSKKAEENLKNADLEKDKTIKEAKDKAFAIVADAEGSANKKKSDILSDAEAKREQIISDARVVIDDERDKMMQGVEKNSEDLLRLALTKVLAKMPADERDSGLIKEALREAKVVK